jgi:FkbM family methyltransferase
MILWPEDYKLAPDHCISVLNGEYSVEVEDVKTVLDLGANVGAFARWAKGKWPEAVIHSYEPHPDNYALLCRTVRDFELQKVFTYNLAVADGNGAHDLYLNGFNCGEWALTPNAATTGEPVKVQCVDAAELPDADVIKVDTEGAEPMILARMARTGRLTRTKAIMLEYHAATMVPIIIQGLGGLGFRLIARQEYAEHRGILKFQR